MVKVCVVAAISLFLFTASSDARIPCFHPRLGHCIVGVKRASWYGSYGRFHDSQDNNRPASGIPNSVPSIAIRRPTLSSARGRRHYYEITFRNGVREVVLHGDFGPSDPGRLDVNARAAQDAGYSPGNFPTDSPVRYRYLGTRLPAGVRLGRQGRVVRRPVRPASAPAPVASVPKELLKSYLSQRGSPGALLSLAVQARR